MHEHLDEMGIIHMNGRVYDPLIGRFMSADPFIQSPMDLQSYNRYAYVRNNPLTMSDPTGHFWWWVVAAIVAPEAGRAVGLWDERTTRIRQGIGLGIVTGGATINWFLAGSGLTVPTVGIAAAGGAVGGFVSGAVITGTLNGAINGAISGALSGALFNAAGMVGGDSLEAANSGARYAAHAAAGCVTSAAGGGSCGQGAVSAVFGKYTTNQIGSSTLISGDIAKGVATAVAGGVGSMIAGGKFENGAVTAGYGYLFNNLASMAARLGVAAMRMAATRPYVFAEELLAAEIGLATPGTLLAAKGFSSFDSFKRSFGSAGEDRAWHHLVEQHGANIERFGSEAIHTASNLVNIDRALHDKITSFMNSNRLLFGGTNRDYVKSLSFEAQRELGINLMKNFSKF